MHCQSAHDFVHAAVVRSLRLDTYGRIRLVNLLRSRTASGLPTTTAAIQQDAEQWMSDEAYLKPVLEADPLLFADDEDDDDARSDAAGAAEAETASVPRAQYEQLLRAFQDYKAMVDTTFMDKAVSAVVSSVRAEPAPSKPAGDEPDDAYYFDGYGCIDIHESMLKDKVRTDAYRDFIYDNKDLFQGKVVLDVGCGTGILSLFAAKAGARRVYAVDNSSIIQKAHQIAKLNGMDGTIQFFRGRIEEIELPEKVDIIVSEWMGYFLLFENMLNSVLAARDRHLKPDGLLAPNVTATYIAAFSSEDMYADRVEYWNNVYGCNMAPMKDFLFREAHFTVLPSDAIASNEQKVHGMQLETVPSKDLDFTVTLDLALSRTAPVHGLVGWFDTDFEAAPSCEASVASRVRKVRLSTSPATTSTHWYQTLFMFREPIFAAEQGARLQGTFTCVKGTENPRHLEVSVHLTYLPPAGSEAPKVPIHHDWLVC
ncbi:hypothetical protein CXG81DRAFT_15179 [Caulochytrium protostelioides]|uniref:type I protein arginine methyltransferase n=1 Tax=Caulochytrium protostelioides TaxID=1555241 RepID=A0A4P9WZ66_9FUNG|nr:S-adenosyl-L-methionine-dependent methyltransferase [Caulochytrium protostelioides]RKO98994.1 hypothetical protein CXG81DRAFT_15179 [Caulochytrium protostelioides]|eukprot:RKO98994.1 hypothetical protein CXG81DRAFT_15179 [Caulochytrium protostelioides]